MTNLKLRLEQGLIGETSDLRDGNLVETVYRKIKEDIFEFFLLPGDRFTESGMASRVGASRTPVREALFRLQQEGYLDVRFRNGWLVKPIDFRLFGELYQIRILLETEAVKTIAASPEEERREALAPLAETWMVPEGERFREGNRVFAADEMFHETLTAMMGNREMTRYHHSISERIRIIRRLDFTREERLAATYREHTAILEALLGGMTERAVALLTRHISESRETVNRITLLKLQEVRKPG